MTVCKNMWTHEGIKKLQICIKNYMCGETIIIIKNALRKQISPDDSILRKIIIIIKCGTE
jgi:hypothetical protein